MFSNNCYIFLLTWISGLGHRSMVVLIFYNPILYQVGTAY